MNRIVAVVASLFLLAACETSPDGSGSASGSGGGDPYSDYSGQPGSMQELAPNVGDRVFFAYDSSVLTAQAEAVLQAQAKWLNDNADIKVTVEGHCDERGTREYNLALGERRANAAKDYLTSLGVSANRVTTISYGKERPAVVGSTDDAWSRNRRSVTVVN